MIEYYSSKLNPDVYFASLDNVIVAIYMDKWGWKDIGRYSPIYNFYYKINWQHEPYNSNILFNVEEWEKFRR
jgi:hypothetical protein